ncbi:hypothetical protein PMG11_07008 [Penicillium brasilianum]|uniref:Uncharacterized protein n=1 Tax=Penicillium brasilianum TaxID=104259 RepID=A0A0F7TNM9_PENBI|nr:hypothetical protein PMG11_07008 [Penicillium brasilianum]
MTSWVSTSYNFFVLSTTDISYSVQYCSPSRFIQGHSVTCFCVEVMTVLPALFSKIFSLHQQYPQLKSRGNWNWDIVDHWIDDLLGNHDSVNKLVLFSPADAENVAINQQIEEPLKLLNFRRPTRRK